MDWRFVDERVLCLLHDESLAEHGGAPGLRDQGLLSSALARPKQLAHYAEPDLADLTACYGVALAKNHAFVDGNKRAAFLAIGLCLAINGHRLVVSQAEATLTIFAVAAGDMSEESLAQWLRQHIQPR